MKHICTVQTKHLHAALNKTAKINRKGLTLPILECLLVKTIAGGLIITTNNMDTCMVTGIKATTTAANKQFTITPAAQDAILKIQTAENIELHIDDDNILQIVFDANKATFQVDDTVEFPVTPVFESTGSFKPELPNTIVNLLQTAVRYIGNDDLRPVLQRVQYTQNHICGTNATIMAMFETKGEGEFNLLISKEAITALDALDTAKGLTVKFDSTYISFNDNSTVIISKLYDTKMMDAKPYPNVHAVIPADCGITSRMNKLELIQNIDIALTAANKTSKRLDFSFSPESYQLCSKDVDYGQDAVLNGTVLEGVDLIDISFNGGNLLHILNDVDKEFTLEMSGPLRPAVVREQEGTIVYLLMPQNANV